MGKIELALGKPLPTEIKLINQAYISTVELKNGHKIIFNGIPNITPNDVHIFNNGKLNIGTFKHQNTVVISTSLELRSANGGKLTTENIYHPYIDEEPKSEFQQEFLKVTVNNNFSYKFVYVLFDTVNRIVHGIRVFEVGRNFTTNIAKQLAEVSTRTMSSGEFIKIVDELQTKYSPAQIAQFCTVRAIVN